MTIILKSPNYLPYSVKVDVTTGITNGIAQKVRPQVYATGNMLKIKMPQVQKSEILLFNCKGIQVAKHTTTKNEAQLDCSQLSNGIYYYRITANGKQFTDEFSIIKQ
jgi:hypothetical protein